MIRDEAVYGASDGTIGVNLTITIAILFCNYAGEVLPPYP
jgi:hypothetical protein